MKIGPIACCANRSGRTLTIAGRTAEADRAGVAFARFWDPERRQLHDVIDKGHVRGAVDASCRPNQIFAIGGVPHPVMGGDRARAVVDTVERILWTEAGLRSLDPADPRYHPHYTGGPAERDRSYHNGTVWPWLAGPFIEAWVRVRGSTPDAKRSARTRFLAPLLARTDLAGLDHLSEICDGDPPHRTAGCPFQAWSLAEASGSTSSWADRAHPGTRCFTPAASRPASDRTPRPS